MKAAMVSLSTIKRLLQRQRMPGGQHVSQHDTIKRPPPLSVVDTPPGTTAFYNFMFNFT